jgi:hypothetical protein
MHYFHSAFICCQYVVRFCRYLQRTNPAELNCKYFKGAAVFGYQEEPTKN